MSSLRIERDDEAVELLWAERPLLRYVYRNTGPQYESPKPYLHPVCTLCGDVVTAFRPEDHVWHKGIQMTAPSVSGQNFWGGATYVHGSGYVDLPNNGAMEHREWERVAADGANARLQERLTWRTLVGEAWIDERRTLDVRTDAERALYALAFTFELRNVAGHELVFGSPATEGRPDAGYGGLFWRGPNSFVGGRVVADGAQQGDSPMGQRGTWLAFTGSGENSRQSTLLFVDDERNPRYPTQWFVRSEPIAAVSFAFAFSETLRLPADEELTLRHRIVVASGADVAAIVEAIL